MLSGTEFRLGPVTYPVLLAAIIGQAARYHRTSFTISWAEVSICCYANGLRIGANNEDLLIVGAKSVKCVQSGDTNPQSLPSTLACDIDGDAWAAIDRLAFKTYAPASAESRAGAGAGLTDND